MKKAMKEGTIPTQAANFLQAVAALQQSLRDVDEIRTAAYILVREMGSLRQELLKQKAVMLRLCRPNHADAYAEFMAQVELEYEALQALTMTLGLLNLENEENDEPPVRPEGSSQIADTPRSLVFALAEGDPAG